MHDLRAVATAVATSPAGRVGGAAPGCRRAQSRNLLPVIRAHRSRDERTDAGRRLCPGRSNRSRLPRARLPRHYREEAALQGCPGCRRDTIMLLEHLDGYEAAQCIAAGGAVLALSAGGCTAYGVALAFVVFLWLAELALPHHAVKARILSPRGTPRPSSQLRKVLADAEVPEIEEQLAELGANAPGDVRTSTTRHGTPASPERAASRA